MELVEPAWPESFELDVSRLESADSGRPFMDAGVELLKEAGILTTIAAAIVPRNPRQRNEAILSGMVARLAKVTLVMVAETCDLRGESQLAVFRQISETAVNLTFLLGDPGDGTRFDAYVADSLIAEREFLKKVQANVASRGSRLPIEDRIWTSIERTAAAAGVELAELPSRSQAGWPTAADRMMTIDPNLYEAFRMGSNAVHGSWSDLYFHHLEDNEDGTFNTRLEHAAPQPQPLISSAALIATAVDQYAEHLGEPAVQEFSPRVRHLMDRLRIVGELHEGFIQRRRRH